MYVLLLPACIVDMRRRRREKRRSSQDHNPNVRLNSLRNLPEIVKFDLRTWLWYKQFGRISDGKRNIYKIFWNIILFSGIDTNDIAYWVSACRTSLSCAKKKIRGWNNSMRQPYERLIQHMACTQQQRSQSFQFFKPNDLSSSTFMSPTYVLKILRNVHRSFVWVFPVFGKIQQKKRMPQ